MERLTSREPRISGMPGVCCTHFEGGDCQAIQGHCADGCAWEEAAWERLAAYEDTGLTPEEIMGLCRMDRRAKMAELLRMEENKPLTPDDLPKMDGTPVYMVDLTGGTLWNQWIIFENSTDDGFIPMGGGWFGAENYGKTWLTYRRKPEEVQHEN